MLGSPGSNLRQETGAEVMEERWAHVWSLQLAQPAFLRHPGAPAEAGTPHRRPGLPATIFHQSNATQTCPLANQMEAFFSADVLSSQMTRAWIELRKQTNTSANVQIWLHIRLASGALTSSAPKHCLQAILTQDPEVTESFKAQKISSRAPSCLEVAYRQALNLRRLWHGPEKKSFLILDVYFFIICLSV